MKVRTIRAHADSLQRFFGWSFEYAGTPVGAGSQGDIFEANISEEQFAIGMQLPEITHETEVDSGRIFLRGVYIGAYSRSEDNNEGNDEE